MIRIRMIRSIDYDSEAYREEHIPGLRVWKDVLTKEEELNLTDMIQRLYDEGSPIRNKIRTRVTMHFGYVFSAKLLKIDFTDNPPKIPDQLIETIDRVFENTGEGNELRSWGYDQITINRYTDKGGIAAHADTHSSFNDTIGVISLGAGTTMRFSRGEKTLDLWLPPRSLLVMQGEARYGWTHKIPTRKTDITPDGTVVSRGDRDSVTIRKVRNDGACDCAYPELCDYKTPESFHIPDRL